MIKLPVPNKKTADSAEGFSQYSSSALDEFSEEQAPTQIEDQQEKEGMVPAVPEEQPEYEEPTPASRKFELPSAPVYPEYAGPSMNRARKDEVEALIEQIMEEKWNELTADVGDISIWKEKVRTEIISIKQELLRIEHRFEEVNKAVVGKVSEYDRSVRTIGTDVKAIEKVLQKILEPLTYNVKELQRVTEKLKK